MLKTTSSSGRRARAPKWWGRVASYVPRLYLPALHPTEWTPSLARKWINSVPPKCPFERQLWWGDRLVLYIPPLCPFNPFSTQLYEIRIEAQTYLSQFKG